MTNAEKLNVNVREFLQRFSNWYYKQERQIKNVDTLVAEFLQEQVKPTLTEDERVILRNIDKEYTKIERKVTNMRGNLAIKTESDNWDWLPCNHLFQFIKERRKIFYWGTFEIKKSCTKATLNTMKQVFFSFHSYYKTKNNKSKGE